MPTYDYQCSKCGNVFEVFHGMSETPKVKCTQRGCTGRAKRLIGGGAGLIFKGSGFYITDYKNGNGKNGKASGDSETKSEVKSEAKSESSCATSGPKSGGHGSGCGCC